MIAKQLKEAREAHWRQDQKPILTLQEAEAWFLQHPLCLFLPRPVQLPAPAPSFVEACLGKADSTPPRTTIEEATGFLSYLTASGKVIALNLFGTPGEQPDFLVHSEALPFVFALRGDRNWKQAPTSSGSHAVSPLVAELWKLLEQSTSITATNAREQLGRELTEAALLRALNALWQPMRVVPVLQSGGEPALWELLQKRHGSAIALGSSGSQVTAVSLLISMYLQSVYAATGEELETFLSPLVGRSRIREAVRGLSATKQIHSLSMDAQTYYFIEGGLPEFEIDLGAEQPVAVHQPRVRSDRDASAPHPSRFATSQPRLNSRPTRPARPAASAGSASRATRNDRTPGGPAKRSQYRPGSDRAGVERSGFDRARTGPPRDRKTGFSPAAKKWSGSRAPGNDTRPSQDRGPSSWKSRPAAGTGPSYPRPRTYTSDSSPRPRSTGAGTYPPKRPSTAGSSPRPRTYTSDSSSRPRSTGAGTYPPKRPSTAGSSPRPRTYTSDSSSRPRPTGAGTYPPKRASTAGSSAPRPFSRPRSDAPRTGDDRRGSFSREGSSAPARRFTPGGGPAASRPGFSRPQKYSAGPGGSARDRSDSKPAFPRREGAGAPGGRENFARRASTGGAARPFTGKSSAPRRDAQGAPTANNATGKPRPPRSDGFKKTTGFKKTGAFKKPAGFKSSGFKPQGRGKVSGTGARPASSSRPSFDRPKWTAKSGAPRSDSAAKRLGRPGQPTDRKFGEGSARSPRQASAGGRTANNATGKPRPSKAKSVGYTGGAAKKQASAAGPRSSSSRPAGPSGKSLSARGKSPGRSSGKNKPKA